WKEFGVQECICLRAALRSMNAEACDVRSITDHPSEAHAIGERLGSEPRNRDPDSIRTNRSPVDIEVGASDLRPQRVRSIALRFDGEMVPDVVKTKGRNRHPRARLAAQPTRGQKALTSILGFGPVRVPNRIAARIVAPVVPDDVHLAQS